MALLDTDNLFAAADKRAAFRTVNVSSKLNRSEVDRLNALAEARGVQRGELVRDLILRELDKPTSTHEPPADLTEIVGLRLLLTTVLKPLATGQQMSEQTFDAIVLEVRRSKTEIAADLIAKTGASQ